MKNLSLWDICTKKYSIESGYKFCACYGHNEESATGELFVCSYNLVVSKFDNSGEIKWTRDLSENVSRENAPVNITYLGLTNCLSVGLANGELIAISDFGNSCDLVGTCENGLLAMEWSPDQELLVLVTKDLNVILMSCTYDPLNESNLLSNEFGEKQFITIGWGKKETQFHGSEGKKAAKITAEIVADKDGELNSKIVITWRGDGSLFAVGFTCDGIRRFKIFDREGNLQYTSEKQPGLEANLSWRPSGNVIATTQKLTDKYIVAFFEKNGLKHGEFTIPVEPTTVVEDLFWSSDSDILALLCKDTATKTQKVLLFTSSNYHWYLKQTLSFNKQQAVGKIMWDNDFNVVNNKKMHIVLKNGEHYAYTWIWNIDHSKGKSDCDDAAVAVIDGKKLLISAFRYTSVPPPMANIEIELDSDIESVHFAPENDSDLNSNSFVAKTDKKFVFLEQSVRNPLRYEISETIPIDNVSFPFHYYNWCWLDSETLICISVDNDSSYQLIQYKKSDGKIVEESVQPLPSAVTRVECHPSIKSAVFLQLSVGEILEYSSDGTIIPQALSFPEACSQFRIFSVDSDIYFLGLSHKGCLYVNDKNIMNNVSSIFIHSSFLLLTTLKHVLLCTELTKSGLSCIEMYERTETSDVYKRKIERGAKLVVTVPKTTRTVFQMPRGNLETIEPRPLSLKIIGEYLDHCKYYDAFDLMRKQRINLNLIYDHNPKLFTESIGMFFDAIQNNSWLNLFLADLENIDVTQTMYTSSYPERKSITDKVHGKIQYVCDIAIAHINKADDYPYRILPLLTAFVKKNDLEKALAVINNLKKEESSESNLPVTSDEALKYLLYMVNVDQLFDVALGMYDFELVLLVANKSQKDPKEYIAMLNELNEMDENYKRFTINKHLKRFEKAVHCLAKCGPSRHGELKTFVKYHSLYREALALFAVDEDIYKQMSEDFGLYLKLKKQFIEAGIIYERSKNYEKAIECYKDALEWELALKLAQDKPKEEFKEMCWDLANSLKEEKRYKEAVTILEQLDEDHEDIINFAIECAQFKTALRFCTKFNKQQLIEKSLLPSLLEEYMNTKELIETNRTNFSKYKNRLQVVNEMKTNKPVDHYDAFYANKDSDLYSDAGSTIASSSGSGRSYRSSKNRRKHERKVASLKEGSQYEDTALVMALHTLVTSTFELRLPVKEINIVLSCLSKDFEALTLQSSLEKTLKEMKDSLKEIWSNKFTLEATNAAIVAENVPEGCTVIPQGMATLDTHLRIAPVVQDLQWKLEGLNL
ncbi:putative elongator complex protein 1 [Maniola hyperantus]|uniref:putative elongator complex protein 1 n=1 Tax=Aphantopus hyperantus TaxID=2795564 RepID=UPI001569E4BD|nr:putative elongator complex protein 1 [Maniola hyperantus]